MPNYYAQIDEESRVFTLSELAGEVKHDHLIPISEEQYQDRRLMHTRYVDGDFQGLFAVIEADKPAIKPDGEDVLTVQVTVTDWQGKVQKAYNEELEVELNGMRQSLKLTKGTADITISSSEPGQFVLKTAGLDRNSELKVVVTDGN